MSKVTNAKKENDDLSILSKHSILPEYPKQDSLLHIGGSKNEYIFKQPPKIQPIYYVGQMPTDYNPFVKEEKVMGDDYHGLINVDSEQSQHFGNEGSTTENTYFLNQPVKFSNQNQLTGGKHTHSKETFMPMRSPQNKDIANGIQTPSLMEHQSPQNPNETMDNFRTKPIIDIEDEAKFKELGMKTIQDFRRVTPKVRKMNDLVHQDQQRLQSLMRTTFGGSTSTPVNQNVKKEILEQAKYQSDFVDQSESNVIDKAFFQMKNQHQIDQIESIKSNTRNHFGTSIRATPTDSNIAQYKNPQFFILENEIRDKQKEFKYLNQADYNESVQQIDGDDIQDRDISKTRTKEISIDNQNSPAKLKLRALSNVKMRLPTLNQGYHYQLDYVKTASMFSLNQGKVKRTQSSLAAPFYNEIGGYKDIKSKYPNLMNELNDAQSPIPAFQRFQRPNSRKLRDDLKDQKVKYFAKNYKNELEKPLAFLTEFEQKNDKLQEKREILAANEYHDDDIFKNAGKKKKDIDTNELKSAFDEQLQISKQTGETMGSEYFEMKYFLNDDHLKGNLGKARKKPILDKIIKKFQQAPKKDHTHEITLTEAAAAVKEEYFVQLALKESQTIPKADHVQNFQDARKTVDKQYQNGQFLTEDLKHKRYASQGSEYSKQVEIERMRNTNASPRRNVLAETKRKFLDDAARAKLFAKKNKFSFKENLGQQNFTFNTENINDISQIKKAPSALSKIYNESKYFKDEQNFLAEGKDYRDYMRNTIKDFNRTITDRSESFNIKLPIQMRLKLNLKNDTHTDEDEQQRPNSDRKPKPRPKKVSYRELMNTRKDKTIAAPMIFQQRSSTIKTSPLKGQYQKNLIFKSSSSTKMFDDNGKKLTSATKVFNNQAKILNNETLMSSYRKTLSNFQVESSYDEYGLVPHFGPPAHGMNTVKMGRNGRASGQNSKQSSTIDLNSLKPSQRMSLKQILHVEEEISETKKHLKYQRKINEIDNSY